MGRILNELGAVSGEAALSLLACWCSRAHFRRWHNFHRNRANFLGAADTPLIMPSLKVKQFNGIIIFVGVCLDAYHVYAGGSLTA